MDEPLSALDENLREDMRREIDNLQQMLGVTTIFVTHDQREALSMSDSIVVMKQDRRRFVENLALRITPGYLTKPGASEAAGLPAGAGRTASSPGND